MKVLSVTTNVKSPTGTPKTTKIGDKTVLIGPNESGKSALAEAIQLALSGSASGLFMRSKPVKAGNQLSALCPGGENTVFAEVTLDEDPQNFGGIARWEVTKGQRVRRTGYSGFVMPVSELRAALSGSPITAYKFFFREIVECVCIDQLLSFFPANRSINESQLLSVMPVDGNPAALESDDILRGLETAGKRKRELQAQAKAADEVLKSLQRASFTSNIDIQNGWSEICTSVMFEEYKKAYRDNEGLRDFLADALLKLGDPEDLKKLPGSARTADRLEEQIRGNALFEVATLTMKTANDARANAEQMANLEKALEFAIQALLEEPLKAYCKRVDEYLPEEDEFVINTDRIFQPALRRPDGVHVALSGSTESRVLGAMAAALTIPGIPSVIILDDRMWDSTTLTKTLVALEDCPAQILIMTTIRPKGKKRAKWTYIQVGEYDEEERIESLAVQEASQIIFSA
mgnify:CR=1 FL=1